MSLLSKLHGGRDEATRFLHYCSTEFSSIIDATALMWLLSPSSTILAQTFPGFSPRQKRVDGPVTCNRTARSG